MTFDCNHDKETTTQTSIEKNNEVDKNDTNPVHGITTPGMVKKHVEKFSRDLLFNQSEDLCQDIPKENVDRVLSSKCQVIMQSQRYNDVSEERAKSNLKGAPPPLRHIFVSRILRGNSGMIVDFLKSKSISVVGVQKMSRMNSKFLSFKISLYMDQLNRVLNDKFWPDGFRCRIWREPNSRKESVNSDVRFDFLSQDDYKPKFKSNYNNQNNRYNKQKFNKEYYNSAF